MDFLAKINPLSYGIDALKCTVIGQQEFSLFLDIAVIVATAVVMISGAVFLFNREG
ncbi:MAG: Daunorubicin resistance ABC transporter, inner membrane subunit B [Clostridia bacterium 41_269]|nr:MAG: Daunorubicin resistance ABC transporter, inner membrane subunit B [Clostridia bacterium 41_269]